MDKGGYSHLVKATADEEVHHGTCGAVVWSHDNPPIGFDHLNEEKHREELTSCRWNRS